MYPNPTEFQLKMAVAQSAGIIGSASHDATSQMSRADHPPVEVSVSRLFERLSQMQVEVDLITERLTPVSRADKIAGEGCATGRAPSECPLVDALDQAAERVEYTINRLSSARSRLCI